MLTDENKVQIYKKIYDRVNKTSNTTRQAIINKIKRDICVHTKGNLFEKVISAYRHENPSAKRHVLETYEPITKDGIWKGINNISRIFTSAEITINGNKDLTHNLLKDDFIAKYVRNWIDISVSEDPNTVTVWLPEIEENGKTKWELEFIKSEFVMHKDDESIIFIDLEKSDYKISEYTKEHDLLTRDLYINGDKCNNKSYTSTFKYTFTKKVFIQITKTEIATIYTENGIEYGSIIHEFNSPLKHKVWANTGTELIGDGIYHSPISPFIPWGNLALTEHRTKRAVDAIFSYPRLVEPESACEYEGCMSGYTSCEVTDEYPEGIKPCNSCKGTGKQSHQSPYNVYTYKVDKNNPNETGNHPTPTFVTPDVSILNYHADAYLKTLKKAEESVYVSQRSQTGNIESFKTKELNMSEMYSWLARISQPLYKNICESLQTRHEIEGVSEKVTISEPVSYAIVSEIEAFEIMQLIVDSKSPMMLKTSQIEAFISKYTNTNDGFSKQIQVLKLVDVYAFYNKDDFNNLNDIGLIPEEFAKKHALAQPILQQMLSMDPELLNADVKYLAAKLNEELSKHITVDPLQKKALTLA